jgi:hypothetical protein
MTFKIQNFCQNHNEEFAIYYNYLKNPIYEAILLKSIEYLEHPRIKQKLIDMIDQNHKLILKKIKTTSLIVSYYKQNNLISRSEIGKFFTFYEKELSKINVNKKSDLLKLFYKLIYYEKCISVLKECFYIFSNYRACIYFMTPSINFNIPNKKNKKIIDKVVISFKDNLNTLSQIISKSYIGDENPWAKYYSTAYSLFDTLLIMQKYYKEPLKELDINFIVKKECNKKDIIKNLCKNYHTEKMKVSDIDDKLIPKNINNISQFIVNMKRIGYDMWFVIPLVFKSIYELYILENVQESIVFGTHNIHLQKTNHLLAVMCYILVKENYITNINILNRFNE